MGVFNYIGLIIIAMLMMPNILYAIKFKDGFKNIYKNKVVELMEQIGRFGCFVFMIVNIPYTYFNFWFSTAMLVYIIVNALLLVMYLLIWVICWRTNSIFKALTLSIIPSIIFLFSGIMLLNIPLIIFSMIFAPNHIFLSYKNAKGETKN